jgi:hypothetical protein
MNLRRYRIVILSFLGGITTVLGLLYGSQHLLSAPTGVEPGLAPSAATQGAALVTVLPPAGPVEVGALFTVTIAASLVDSPLSAFQFDLVYNPAVLAFRFAEEGPFLGAAGREVVCPEPAGNAGVVRLACASTGPGPGAVGDGILTVLTFEAAAEGVSDLTLSDGQLADTGRPPVLLPTTLQNGQVIVGTPPGATVTSTPTVTPVHTATPSPTTTATAMPTAIPSPLPTPAVRWLTYLPFILR